MWFCGILIFGGDGIVGMSRQSDDEVYHSWVICVEVASLVKMLLLQVKFLIEMNGNYKSYIIIGVLNDL